jgi:DNA-binding transcriptional MocR family regulator
MDGMFSCFPSYRQLSLDTGYQHETLMKAAKELEADRAIQRRKRKQTSNMYYLNFDLIQKWAQDARAAEAEAAGPIDDFKPSWAKAHKLTEETDQQYPEDAQDLFDQHSPASDEVHDTIYERELADDEL